MKIKTQAWLLVTSILLTPLLIFLITIVARQFFNPESESNMAAYEEVYSLLNEHLSAGDRESVRRFISSSQRLGEITVFRDDFLVLYSTNSDFSSGVFIDNEKMLAFFDSTNLLSNYTLSSHNIEDNRIFILTKIMPPPLRPRNSPFFVPAVTVLGLIITLTLFAVCMSIIIAFNITRSVQVLENATRRIAEGELDLDVYVKGSNEITSLTNSLNKMRNALKEDELMRSRFIMGISHDLKTPLALIKGYAEAIEDGVAEDTVSKAGAAEIIVTKADQLEGMINDLIDFVRMDTGEWRAQLKHINLKAFLHDMLKTMSTDVELLRHGLSHTIDLPDDLEIPMDERLVFRAFENLINNAVRYSHEMSLIRFGAALADNAVTLSITNNGPGISSADLPHVFEVLYRGSSSRREQGMGLGLAVVKWVADYHGWTISAASETGKETCFTITIPFV